MTKILKSHSVLSGDVRPVILNPAVLELSRDRSSRSGQTPNIKNADQSAAVKQLAADRILEQAHQQAQEIMQKSKEQAEHLKRDAQAQGFATGIQKAQMEFDLKAQKLQANLQDVIGSLNTELEKRLDELEPEMLKLSLSIAEKILQMELDRDERSFVSLARSAIAQLKTSPEIQIRVNAADLAHLTAEFGFKPQNPDQIITFKTEPSLQPGSLFLDSESGTINASAKTQLEKIRQQLLGVSS